MIFEMKENGEIYMDGTLTQVLCVLDALNDEPREEKKSREDWVKDFNFDMDNHKVFNFLGNEVRIIGTSRTTEENKVFEFYFSDGSELKLKC